MTKEESLGQDRHPFGFMALRWRLMKDHMSFTAQRDGTGITG
jgi:hypothetical protein